MNINNFIKETKEVTDELTRSIIKKDGKSYTIRKNRNRYLFPEEWLQFKKDFKNKDKLMLFDLAINTGGRIEEILFLRPKDYNEERNVIRFWKTKTKAKKGETEGKDRSIPLSTEFGKKLKKYINPLNPTGYIFESRKKGHPITKQAAWSLFRARLKKCGIKDWNNFGMHNLRKTHGMWLKAIGVPAEEICFRLGHDYNTFLKHYGSPDIFTNQDLNQIRILMGDLYMRHRRF